MLYVKVGFGSIPRGWLDDLKMSIFAAFCGIFALRPVSAHFSALDDEEFFVVEGSGWRGRRESDSKVFFHPNSMHAWWHIDKDMSLTSRPHHYHQSRLIQVAQFLFVNCF